MISIAVIVVLSLALLWALFSRSNHVSKAWAADRRVDAAHDRERKWCAERNALQARIADLEATLGHWREYQSDRHRLNEHQFVEKYYRR